MRIDICGKNREHITTLECDAGDGVPRVGEYILTPTAVLEDVDRIPQLLVVDVHYILEDGRAVAVVDAMANARNADTRLDRLQEQGWLRTD